MTIFQKIINREVPADIIYENEYILAFKDIHPQAKIHLLVIPKIDIKNVNDINDSNIKYVTEIFKAIPIIAENEELKSYRVVTNCGVDAGQEVYHLHFHILGGEKLGAIC